MEKNKKIEIYKNLILDVPGVNVHNLISLLKVQ